MRQQQALPQLQLTPSTLGVCIAGVEHLLRNVKDATISTLASDVSAKLQALKGLKTRLSDVQVGQALYAGSCVGNCEPTGLQYTDKQGTLTSANRAGNGCLPC